MPDSNQRTAAKPLADSTGSARTGETSQKRRLLFIYMIAYVALLLAIIPGTPLFALFLLYIADLLGVSAGLLFCVVAALYLFVMSIHMAIVLIPLLFFRRGKDVMEVEIPPKWMTGLYRLADGVAERRGLPKPDEIRLHAFSLAHVYEDRGRRRILVVGAMALASFTKKALAGVIAHELGHFHGGDTTLLRWSSKWMTLVEYLEYRFEHSDFAKLNILFWGLHGFHYFFRSAWAEDSREAEFAADRQEIELVGPEQAARTTILISAVEHLPFARLDSVAEMCVQLHLPASQIFTEQARRSRETTPSDWEKAFRKALKVKTKPFDTHPSMKERLKPTGLKKKQCIDLARQLNTDGDPASALLENWPGVEKILSTKVAEIYEEVHAARQEIAQIVLGRPL